MKIKSATLAGLLLTSTMSMPAAPDVVSLWGGARSTIILKSDGTVWTWGGNLGGKLGIGDPVALRSLVPIEVHGMQQQLSEFHDGNHGRRDA